MESKSRKINQEVSKMLVVWTNKLQRKGRFYFLIKNYQCVWLWNKDNIPSKQRIKDEFCSDLRRKIVKV